MRIKDSAHIFKSYFSPKRKPKIINTTQRNRVTPTSSKKPKPAKIHMFLEKDR